jgi:dTDP-glucose 4,6-dehydratase
MKKIVYVTGCLGFIGYHVTTECLNKGWYVIGVDKETYAANLNLLPNLLQYKNFKYIKSDINDLDYLYDCDYVINTAAETHVDNSIISSESFLKSNINGVQNLLELIKQKHKFKMPTLLHFSTDEVYGDIIEGAHKESDLLKPSNPYSATKASADMLILAWARTYDVPYIIVRPTNNYGVGQYVEKLIPKACKYLTLGRKIPVHANGEPKRTWLHVDDTASAIIHIIESETVNEIYNISGNFEEKIKSVVETIVTIYNNTSDINFSDYIDFGFKRPGHDVRYSIDDSKLKSLGWEPKSNFSEKIIDVVEYYKTNFIW